MTFNELKNKANSLPYEPGVYIMRDNNDTVIYVGKAKKLKNRVCQYFIDLDSHSPKTKLMVSKIHHFDVIVASSEFEAFILECSLIKQYMPKYNILLKDDKGFPYIRLDTSCLYPRMTIANKLAKDKAEYFGPFGNRGTTQNIIDTVETILMLPKCKKHFPRDIGKERPCLNYHMNQCAGWCQTGNSQKEYLQLIQQAKNLLNGNYKQVYSEIKSQMLTAAESLNFELASILRDRLKAVESLGKKQLVTALSKADTDVIGYSQFGNKACFSLLHYSNGMLLDKEYEIFSLPDSAQEAVSSLVKQYYFKKGSAPRNIILPYQMEESELFVQLLSDQTGTKVKIYTPVRGEKKHLVDMANKNAFEEVQRVVGAEERCNSNIQLLGKMLSINPPRRIESFDISNISGTDIVAGMVVFVEGKPKRSDYKKFKIKDLMDQNDYMSMQQALQRRFLHYINGDKGFEKLPDLLLIDGGSSHADVAQKTLSTLDLSIPVFGMVKDDKHRTRSLVTPDGSEISIDSNQNVFSFIGTIQEETHRFAINYHKKLRSKRLQYSELDNIPGVGAKRKQELLKNFHSISAIRSATVNELERFLPKNVALAVFMHFHPIKKDAEI